MPYLTRKEYKILLKSEEEVIVSSSETSNITVLGVETINDAVMAVELQPYEVDSLIEILQLFRKEMTKNEMELERIREKQRNDAD